MKNQLKNLVMFKLGWVACVGLAAAGQPLWATLAVAFVVTLHLAGVPVVVKEALLLAASAVIGLAWESLLVWSGLLSYPASGEVAPLAPYWIVAMWVLFATTINHGLRWAKRSWMIAAVAGMVGGPMAFYGGAAMGAVEFSHTLLALAAIGAGWAVLMPLLTLIADTIIDSDWLEPREAPRPARLLPIFERRLGGER